MTRWMWVLSRLLLFYSKGLCPFLLNILLYTFVASPSKIEAYWLQFKYCFRFNKLPGPPTVYYRRPFFAFWGFSLPVVCFTGFCFSPTHSIYSIFKWPWQHNVHFWTNMRIHWWWSFFRLLRNTFQATWTAPSVIFLWDAAGPDSQS